MNEDIEKIIEYFKNDAWFTIFNAEECNNEPYKLLNPIEVNQVIEYITKLQNNWNELKKWCKENQYNNAFDSYQVDNYTTYGVILKKMQELEQGKDENN